MLRTAPLAGLAVLLATPLLLLGQITPPPTPGGGTPSGPAGGDLCGTYPNPNACLGGHLTTGSVVVAQKFFGTAPPGSVTGNLPGDTFNDTTNHITYVCNAPSGTAAPACTSVTTGGWMLAGASLPTATAAGQIPASTAAGTNYAVSSILSLFQTPLTQPSTPVITQGGTPAAKTYFYSIVPLNAFGFGLASPYATTTTGATTLNGTNYNIITTAAVTGSISCDVFRSTLNGGVPSGNWIFVGNIACGAAFNDQTNSPSLTSTYGEGGNGLVDESAGLLMTRNAAIQGSLAVGGPVPGGGNAQQTSGIAQMSVSQTVQGSVAPISDPVLLALNMTIDPSGLGVNQPWMLQGVMTVPSTNAATIPSLEGLSINVTDNGTGVLQQADGGLFNVNVGPGLTSSGSATTTDFITGARSFGFVQSSIPTYSGYSSQIALSGAGTISRLSMYRASNLLLGTTPVTTFHIFDPDAPLSGSAVTNYATYYAADAHATGTSSSYAFRSIGALFASKLDGPLTVGAFNIGAGSSLTSEQGAGTALQTAGVNSGTLAAPLCNDATAAATTSGCPASIPSGAPPQVPIYAASGTTLTPWQNVWRFAADQSVTSSTTLINSTGAVIPLLANQTYFFDAYIYATSNLTGGLKLTPAYQGTLSASSDGYETYTNVSDPTPADIGFSFSGFQSLSYTTTGTQYMIHYHGTITTTSAANFQFQFAQNTTSITATTLKANSTIHIWPTN